MTVCIGGRNSKLDDHGQDARATSNHGRDAHATSVNIRHGAYLPHWTRDSSIYSVTFRLYDSLPRSVVEAWQIERDVILRKSRRADRPLTDNEARRLQYLFSSRVDRFMDLGQGVCWLRHDEIAQVVAEALQRFHGDRYDLYAWCVVPNHVHVVVRPLPERDLPGIMHSWKSFTAKEANRMLKRRGRFWQPEYYDHLIRNEDDLVHSIEYVLHNPQRAGLADWKWVG